MDRKKTPEQHYVTGEEWKRRNRLFNQGTSLAPPMSSRPRIRKSMVREVQTSITESAASSNPHSERDDQLMSSEHGDLHGKSLNHREQPYIQAPSFKTSAHVAKRCDLSPIHEQTYRNAEIAESTHTSLKKLSPNVSSEAHQGNFIMGPKQHAHSSVLDHHPTSDSIQKYPSIFDSKYAYPVPAAEDVHYKKPSRIQARILHQRSLQRGIALHEARIAHEIEEGSYVEPMQIDGPALVESLAAVFTKLKAQPVLSTNPTANTVDEPTNSPISDVFMANTPTREQNSAQLTPVSDLLKLSGNVETGVELRASQPEQKDVPRPTEVMYGSGTMTGLVRSSTEAMESKTPTVFEGMRQFDTWVAPIKRPGHQKSYSRRILMTGLPHTANARQIACLVFGGPIEQIILSKGQAEVLFLKTDNCMAYYEKKKSGFDWPDTDSGRFQIVVQLADYVEPTNGTVQKYIQSDMTRCVKVIGVAECWFTVQMATHLAIGKGPIFRRLEHLNLSLTESGARKLEFRFCSIKDAVAFRGQLLRDDAWEGCNIQFFKDPCDEPENTRI